MFAENIRILRTEREKSQQDMADYLQITRQAYSYYETGKRQPDYETLLKLGEYFNNRQQTVDKNIEMCYTLSNTKLQLV